MVHTIRKCREITAVYVILFFKNIYKDHLIESQIGTSPKGNHQVEIDTCVHSVKEHGCLTSTSSSLEASLPRRPLERRDYSAVQNALSSYNERGSTTIRDPPNSSAAHPPTLFQL